MSIILYARKSIENEVSISCETQLEYCRSMLRPHEKEEEIISIVDNGCSGGNTDREGFQRMMQLVERGCVSKVIVYKLDRFSRSFVDFANSMEIFRQHQVKFISSQEAFDTGSSYGEMVMQILMVFAQFERSSIIDRITQAYAHRSDLGFYMGGNRPFGFQLVPAKIHGIPSKKLQPLPAEAATVNRIFQLYGQETLSLRQLQKLLQAEQHERLWTTSKLSALLKNPIYVRADADIYHYFEQRGVSIKGELSRFDGRCGAQLYGRSKHDPALPDWSDLKLVLLTHEGIVDSDIWLLCQRKLEQNRRISNSYSNQSSWLAGKVFCEKCGQRMTTIKGSPNKNGAIRRYFHCTGKSHKRICSGPQVTVYAEELENLMDCCIVQKLRELGQETLPSKPQNFKALNQLKLNLKAIEQAEAQLTDQLLSGSFHPDLLALANQKASRLKQERQALLERMEELRRKECEGSATADLAQAWREADFSRKKAAALLLLQQILVGENGSVTILWNL